MVLVVDIVVGCGSFGGVFENTVAVVSGCGDGGHVDWCQLEPSLSRS